MLAGGSDPRLAGAGAAERLRQWPRVLDLAEVAARPPFLGVVLLGSFARGEADDLSDVDFIVFAGEGDFEEAWEQRHHLHPKEASCWDYPRPPGDRDVAGHRWLTPDFVLFDGLIATPSGTRIADPVHVLVGDDVLKTSTREARADLGRGAAPPERRNYSPRGRAAVWAAQTRFAGTPPRDFHINPLVAEQATS